MERDKDKTIVVFAPKLLEALKRLVHHADHCGIDCDQASEVIVQAYAAIAKAEGKS